MKHVQYYIGIERDREGRQINPEVRALALQDLRLKAANVFGGYTLSNAEGGRFDAERNKLVEEGAVRLDIYTDAPKDSARAFAHEAGKLFNQTAVLFDYAGEVEYVH